MTERNTGDRGPENRVTLTFPPLFLFAKWLRPVAFCFVVAAASRFLQSFRFVISICFSQFINCGRQRLNGNSHYDAN